MICAAKCTNSHIDFWKISPHPLVGEGKTPRRLRYLGSPPSATHARRLQPSHFQNHSDVHAFLPPLSSFIAFLSHRCSPLLGLLLLSYHPYIVLLSSLVWKQQIWSHSLCSCFMYQTSLSLIFQPLFFKVTNLILSLFFSSLVCIHLLAISGLISPVWPIKLSLFISHTFSIIHRHIIHANFYVIWLVSVYK